MCLFLTGFYSYISLLRYLNEKRKERKKEMVNLSAAKIMHLHANYEEIFYQGR